MRKIIIITLILSAISIIPAITRDLNVTEIKEQITKVLSDSEKGWNNGNLEEYMQCYHKSEKMRFAGNGNFNLGWTNTLKRYKKSYPDKKSMGKLTFSDVDITVLSKDSSLVFGRWTLHYKDKKRTGLYTLILKKFKEGWRIIHDHSSSKK